MISAETQAVIANSKSLYEVKLRRQLERNDIGRFVAIEPESGEFFLADTFDEAVKQALEKYPGRRTHTIRVGYPAALHLGVLVQ